jgi:glutamate-1-semialdehyde aminotransferase
MSMVRTVVGGVDTHADVHVAAAIDGNGGMSRRTTTVRIPENLAEEADIVARCRGVSVNALMLDALQAAIDCVRSDADFMETLRALTERDREILDRLTE